MSAVLVAISDAGLGRKYAIGDVAVVGRHPECDVQLVDSQVSKQHARIIAETGSYHAEDLGSLNGVYVNGNRIEGPTRLQQNDLLAIGDHAFVFNPDLDILPTDDGSHALVMTSEGRTQTADTLRRPLADCAMPGDPFVNNLLSLLARNPDPKTILPELFDRLADEVPFDSAALLLVTEDGVDTAHVQSEKRTVSIPSAIAAAALEQRQGLLIPDAVGDTSFSHGKSVVSQQVRSVLITPLLQGETCTGAVYLTRDVAAAYREQDLDRLLALTPVINLALGSAQRAQKLEHRTLAHGQPIADGNSSILGNSQPIVEVRELIAKAAPAPSPVLVFGETGSGKELIAHELHRLGQHPDGPLIAINCGAIPEHLMESEFFGHERGAFSGADKQKPGTLELASGGTLFLDEIGELPANLQVKLLRALEHKSFYRVGGVKPVKVEFRLVAATHRDLQQMIRDGGFREDLYFRINVLAITNPPLRERPTDVAVLAGHFLEQLSRELGKSFHAGFNADALALLERYAWPGNIRELRNIVERVVVLAEGPEVLARDLPADLTGSTNAPPAMSATGTLPEQVAALERQRVADALRLARGKKVDAAKALGISRPTLDKKIKDYGIDIFEAP